MQTWWKIVKFLSLFAEIFGPWHGGQPQDAASA
jgi:hypothetical protein